MKFSNYLLPLFVTAVLTACGGGGGGGSTPGTPSAEAKATWAGSGVFDFSGVSVGSTTERVLEVTNSGTGSGDFSRFDGLPAGVTAEGCTSVAAGAKCAVKFTFKPTVAGTVSGEVSPSGISTAIKTVVSGKSFSTVPQAISMYAGAPGVSSWTGALNVLSPTGVTLVLKDVRTVTTASTDTCSVTIQGSYPLELAGKHFEFGGLVFTVPASGTVSTAGNVTTTTFSQPVRDFACWYVPYPSELSYAEVKMY